MSGDVKPVTALPWVQTVNFVDARNADGSCRGEQHANGDFYSVATCHGARGERHAEYIVHAANAYPKLVAAMRAILFQVVQGKVLERDACIATARTLLHELGEAS